MAGKFVCVSSDEDLKERVELPDRVVLVNNGAFDLEQKGLSGFYVWVGYRHDDSGSSEISMKSVLQKTTHSVGKWLQEYAGTKYEVDDFWKDLEMYRVWAGGENMDVDRKKKDESIEIKEDCQIPGTDIVLEAGDKINLISKVIEDTNVSTDDFDSKYPVKWSDIPMYQSKSFVFYEGFNGLDHYHKTVTKPGTDAFKYGVKVCLPDWHNDDIYVVWNGYDKKNGSVNPFRLVDCINEALKFAKQISGYMRVDVRYI